MDSMFGDMRLDKRLERLTEQLSITPIARLPQALTNWSSLKAGYRFVNNASVTHEGIIELERQATRQRAEAEEGKVILAVQDTTSFNFANRTALKGLGVLDDNKTPGFFAHTTLAVSEQGVPLGVLDQQVWSRSRKHKRDKEARKAKPITEKESFKWLQGTRQLPVLPQQVITVCDREADIYEVFQDVVDRELDFIVRVRHNRRLAAAPRLGDCLAHVAVADTYPLTIRRQIDQAERTADVELRYTTITVLPPDNRPKHTQVIALKPLQVQVVEVREINPPDEIQDPIHWLLLTTLSVETVTMAHRIVRFYTYRWLVERFHYVLKSGGCHFEDSQLRTVKGLHRLLGICSRVAWRLLWLTYQARQTPNAACTVALSHIEWQALTAFTAHSPTPALSPPTLKQAVHAIARLGGFVGRKSDGDPGVKTLWRSVKYEDIYVKEYPTVPALEYGLHDYFQLYNYERPHQSLDYRTPAMIHFGTQGNQ